MNKLETVSTPSYDATLTPSSRGRSGATFIIVLAGILWSFSGILIKEIHWNAFAIAATRSFIGGSLQFAFLFFALKKSKENPGSAAALTPYTLLKEIVWSKNIWQWAGAIAFVSNMIALVFAFQLWKAANAVFLHYSGLVLVGVLSGPILHQKPKPHDWIALGIALTGIALLTLDGLSVQAYAGTMLGIFCGFTLAIDNICLGKRIQQDAPTFGALKNCIVANLLMTLIGLPSIISSCASGTLPPAHEWILLILLGIVPWGVPDILYTIGIKWVPVLRALILGMLDPVLTAVWPIFFIGECPSALGLLGCAIVPVAIVYQAYFEERRLAHGEA